MLQWCVAYFRLFSACFFSVCLALAACTPQVSTTETPENSEVRLEPHFTGLTQPTDLRFLPDGRALASEQAGRVVLLERGHKPQTVLDLRERVGCCGERGLLSLALHPSFARNGLVFFYAADRTGGTTLSRVTLNLKTLEADPESLQTLLKISQPGPTHNGGQLQFGPDAHLYLSTGDGEYRPSWLGALPYAQETDKLLGKLLRFRVSQTGVLSIPKDNPFTSAENASAVWALGLRNPWRFSFDWATGALYVTDVGETQFEEVSAGSLAASKGANYGWPHAEGPECRQKSCAAFVMPALSYTHAEGCAVTGGYVYRGDALPELSGHYLYGDFCTGTLWAAAEQKGAWQTRVLLQTPLVISSFAQDNAGEMYVLGYGAGTVYKLVAAK